MTIPPSDRASPSWDERLTTVERRLSRLVRAWNAWHLTTKISTSTGQTGPISTATTAASPTTGNASTRRSLGSLLRLARTHLPKLLGWAVEQLFRYLWPFLLSAAVAGWALVRKYSQEIAEWLTRWWLWLFG